MRKFLVVLFSFCLILSGCTKMSTVYTLEDVNHIINIPLIYNETLEQQLSDGSFSYWPDEVPEDIYSTYYSIEILKLLNFEYEEPIYNIEKLNQNVTSLYDLYLFVSLFSNNIKSNEKDFDIIIELLNEYKINDYLYTIDKSYIPANLNNDEVVLMATLYAVNIYELLDIEYDKDKLIDWSQEYFKNCILVDNILDRYDQLYMLMCITIYISNDASLIYDEVRINFEQYENELINNIDNTNFIFYLNTYIDIIKLTNLESVKINKEVATKVIQKHTGDNGGFIANTGDIYNSLPMFIIVKLANQFDLELDYEDIIRIILLHKRIDNYFIPYIITAGDTLSTYYSDYICNEILNTEFSINEIDKVRYSKFNLDNNDSTILRIEELTRNYTPSYSTMEELRILLEYCYKHNISIIDIDLENILDSTLEYLTELDNTKENKHRIFMANSLIALIDYKRIDDTIFSEIKKIEPSNLLEAYHVCILLNSLRIAGLDLNNYYDNNLINDVTTSLYNVIDENGLFCTDNSKEAASLSSIYMGMKVYEEVNYLLSN